MKDTEYIPYLSGFHAEMLELHTAYIPPTDYRRLLRLPVLFYRS